MGFIKEFENLSMQRLAILFCSKGGKNSKSWWHVLKYNIVDYLQNVCDGYGFRSCRLVTAGKYFLDEEGKTLSIYYLLLT